jgi:hypothetical protein
VVDQGRYCAQCGALSAQGRFCAACGAATAPAMAMTANGPTTPVGSTTFHPPTVGRLPSRIRIGRNTITVLIVVLALTGASAYLLARPGERTVPGTVSLEDTNTVAGLTTNDECSGSDGYSDMRAGTQAVLMDSRGATIGTSQLGEGRFDGEGCVFHFTFHDVPKAHFYALKIGYTSRGNFQSSYGEMVRNNWALDVSLGT